MIYSLFNWILYLFIIEEIRQLIRVRCLFYPSFIRIEVYDNRPLFLVNYDLKYMGVNLNRIINFKTELSSKY